MPAPVALLLSGAHCKHANLRNFRELPRKRDKNRAVCLYFPAQVPRRTGPSGALSGREDDLYRNWPTSMR